MAFDKEGNLEWVDDLRGLASSLVVSTHIARAFDGDLFSPASAADAAPRLLQLPFLRILVQGRITVSIFAFVTGYVCMLKPVKLSRQGNQENAFTSISKSALRRIPRLIIPTTLAACIIWVMAQLGFFLVAKHSDCWWCGATAPDQVPRLGDALHSLVYNIITTWTHGRNSYDRNQWTLLPLLKGSFWSMSSSWGVFICDLQNLPSANDFIMNRPRISKVLAIFFLIISCFISSYPKGHPEWQSWSAWQFSILKSILPNDPDFPRFGSGIGLKLITLDIHFSPFIKDVLSSKYLLWLGKQSFAIYLLHGLLRWLLCWIIYGARLPADIVNDAGETISGKLIFPGAWKLILCLPVWLPLNYAVANLWITYVDPWCAQLTEQVVGHVKENYDEKEGGADAGGTRATTYREIVQLLLDSKADVNAQGGEYGNALCAASSGGHQEIVKVLVDNGAHVNAQGGKYGNAVYIAFLVGHERMVQLLLDNKADWSFCAPDRFIPFTNASYNGHLNVVKLLLQAGADFSTPDMNGWTPLCVASSRGHVEIVEALITIGAHDIDTRGINGRTALA
ncbi:uncharacterized protein JN550_013553 [Neoarthrinium moseri]|uniref:uncharacterized protein n=1 Tax=Neoarthrinium moseri TaxID=1658444 RepID=UPI001FDCD896|nr:uncharacterized protein JN550_013553 [Neoarthrinium moseri]KAI1856951.1 hypothetical protein JN550_013553 [Neoarthrinium moseri]